MDLNDDGLYFSQFSEFAKNDNFGDTILRLDCLGYGNISGSQFIDNRNNTGVFTAMTSDEGCRLVLGLGPTPRTYYDVKQTKGSSTSMFHGLSINGESSLKLGLSGETAKFFGCVDFSTSTNDIRHSVSVADEGSTSAKKSGGYTSSLLLSPTSMGDCERAPAQMWEILEFGANSASDQTLVSSEHPSMKNCRIGASSEPSGAVSSVENKVHNTKRCRFMGCTKGARGGSGLCIGHGGGHRCQKHGCNKGAESRTAYCKAHGGGRRCQHLGCTKSAEGKTDFCIAHGGGRRCGFPGGCTKAARGKSGLCIRHGGGKRCRMEGCTRSAEGQAGMCISHGGGRRCQFTGCAKGAQGSTIFCKAHGGGKRCVFVGCTKGAEGSTPLCKGHGGGKRCMFDGGGICPKSVHGGTNFCVAHGGGKRCAVPGCTKSARGRTNCCVRHGGGKRCKVENCGKSAQGSTDFCKAHGGGKRCNWGGGNCAKFARGRSGMCAAHSNMAQEREKAKQGMIGPGLFHGLVSATTSTGTSVISDSGDSLGRATKQRQLIPPEVLVPLSMKSVSSYSVQTTVDEPELRSNSESGKAGFEFFVPEGRVHGGDLMSLLGGNMNNGVHDL